MRAQEGGQGEGQCQGQARGAAQGRRSVAQLGVAAGHGPRQADAVHVRGHALAGAGLGHGGVPQEGVHCGRGAPASGRRPCPCRAHGGVTAPSRPLCGPAPFLPPTPAECLLCARARGPSSGIPHGRGGGEGATVTPGAALPAQRPLTQLQGVERSLAHGLVGTAGGDGDAAGRPCGLRAAVALQGYRWVGGDEEWVRWAPPLPSPLSWRLRFEGGQHPPAPRCPPDETVYVPGQRVPQGGDKAALRVLGAGGLAGRTCRACPTGWGPAGRCCSAPPHRVPGGGANSPKQPTHSVRPGAPAPPPRRPPVCLRVSGQPRLPSHLAGPAPRVVGQGALRGWGVAPAAFSGPRPAQVCVCPPLPGPCHPDPLHRGPRGTAPGRPSGPFVLPAPPSLSGARRTPPLLGPLLASSPCPTAAPAHRPWPRPRPRPLTKLAAGSQHQQHRQQHRPSPPHGPTPALLLRAHPWPARRVVDAQRSGQTVQPSRLLRSGFPRAAELRRACPHPRPRPLGPSRLHLHVPLSSGGLLHPLPVPPPLLAPPGGPPHSIWGFSFSQKPPGALRLPPPHPAQPVPGSPPPGCLGEGQGWRLSHPRFLPWVPTSSPGRIPGASVALGPSSPRGRPPPLSPLLCGG